MARRNVEDGKGNSVGQIDDQPNQIIAYDTNGRRVGRFDKKRNSTFDASGKELGKGDLLRRRIYKLG